METNTITTVNRPELEAALRDALVKLGQNKAAKNEEFLRLNALAADKCLAQMESTLKLDDDYFDPDFYLKLAQAYVSLIDLAK